ncbi:MAG: hypothetical protein COW00_05210 [Bdellovibrio sp. CG12_big_fil_rev_8_21_14_0_65_39_13]|nr:MAG: hypothetical protein COW78_13410 [Bdellovibrio sp. CG22_combo_CG10-13_8_21_14_all_39_27]PIQ61208.1 MAG: hypothetical protein COW00_05210 [Bdellovibrio sp. CG12_big_fil_rev_8_21_14_0_65_39_13]PIR34878.1 MAG: hypothetical protein COV37_11485 [Bdellovibrio sp. CG11_big_fil_rev_8_21_14_0_20_39_38]
MRKTIILLTILTITASCRKNSGGGSGGGYSGSAPTAGQVADWLGNQTNPPGGCGDIQPSNPHTPPRIMPNGNHQWKTSWSKAMMKALDHPQLNSMINGEIKYNQSDLEQFGCPRLNEATPEQKKQFWVLYMASVALPESGFDERQVYVERTGDWTKSTGLLQIDEASARRHGCYSRTGFGPERKNYGPTALDEIHLPPQSMKLGETNAVCGLYIMRNHLMGGYTPESGQLYRPDLKGRLLHGKQWYWSVLQKQQGTITQHFQAHAVHQLPFCNKAPTQRSDLPKELSDSVQRQTSGESQVYSKNCAEIGNEGRNRTSRDFERIEKPILKNFDSITK